MNNTKLDYDRLSQNTLSHLRTIAKDMKIPRYTSMTKENLLDEISTRLREFEKHKSDSRMKKYEKISQLGCKGKEGDVYLVKKPRSSKEYAMKKFSSKKSGTRIAQEARLQKLGSQTGVSPKVIEYDTEAKFIIMEKLEKSLFDILKNQKGKLKLEQQKRIVTILKNLDNIGVFHGDASLLNFLEDKGGRLYIIDYGFAKEIDEKLAKKYGTRDVNIKFMVPGILLKLKEIYPEGEYKYLLKFVTKEDAEKYRLK